MNGHVMERSAAQDEKIERGGSDKTFNWAQCNITQMSHRTCLYFLCAVACFFIHLSLSRILVLAVVHY
jgi:hypothetical protein